MVLLSCVESDYVFRVCFRDRSAQAECGRAGSGPWAEITRHPR